MKAATTAPTPLFAINPLAALVGEVVGAGVVDEPPVEEPEEAGEVTLGDTVGAEPVLDPPAAEEGAPEAPLAELKGTLLVVVTLPVGVTPAVVLNDKGR